MIDILLDTLFDTLKIIPFLLIAFLIIEFIEHKLSKKNENILLKNRKYAPFLGGILGMVPQCGFSALATNLFSSRVITLGTLFAVYLSTSDEMLPLLLSGGIPLIKCLKIISLKAGIGIMYGFIIDLILRKKNKNDNHTITKLCQDEHCHCEKNLFLASIKHTLNIALYLFLVSFIIGILINHVGENNIQELIKKSSIFAYPISSLIGLIPNCASSVIITELYINGIISIGHLLSGLLTGAGVGLLVLFKTNKNLKENIFIIILLFILGMISGFLIDLIGITL